MSRPASLLFVLIVTLAGITRFYALDRIPPGIWIDEAWKGNLGLEAVRTGDFRIFYPDNQGREGLWINMLGVAEALFGLNQLALRSWAALAGTLTVIFLYLLARDLFSKRVALFSAWFLATSFWHLNFSRIAFRAILVPLLVTASLHMLLRTWREQDQALHPRWPWLTAIVGGTLCGLGFHSYIAFRFAPLLIAMLLIFEYLRRRTQGGLNRQWFALTGLWLGAAFVAALPMGLYFLHNPQDFSRRAGSVGVFPYRFSLLEFDVVLWRTLAMFNLQGDLNWRHNLAGAPQLLLPVGLAFVLGIWVAVRRTLQQGIREKSYWLLAAWFVTFLLPAVLSVEGSPHALRATGVIPPVFIFAGIGTEALYEKVKKRKSYRWAFLAVVALVGPLEYYRYFHVWARSPQVAAAFCQPWVRAGQYLNRLPPETPRYVVVNETGALIRHVNPDGAPKLLPIQAQVIMFVTGEKSPVTYLLPDEIRHTRFAPGSVIVPLRPEKRVFRDLADRELKVREITRENFTALIVD